MQKEIETLENAADTLVKASKKAGVTACEVCANYGRSTRITLEKQDYHLASSESGFQFGLRVLIGERQGFASCNFLSTQELANTALQAVEIAGFSPPNPLFAINPSSAIPSHAPTDELWDDSLDNVSIETQLEWSQALLEEATRDHKFRLNEGSVSVHSGASLVVNSHGTHQCELETQAAWSAMGMAVDQENITSFDYFSRILKKNNEVSSHIVRSTRAFRDAVVAGLNHGPARSYRGIVAFSPRALLDIFVSTLEYHLNGRNTVEGTTRWKREDIGSVCIPDEFTLIDKPWLTDRAGAAFFDREGSATSNKTLIERGKLLRFMTDHYAGRALEVPSTGNAIGSPSSPPTVGSHCLVLEPGGRAWGDLLDLVGHQNEILLVHRFSGQTDPVSGDFSGVAKGAQWLYQRQPVYYVRETLISGNVFEALKNCVGLSKECEIVDSASQSPLGLFDSISVTGH